MSDKVASKSVNGSSERNLKKKFEFYVFKLALKWQKIEKYHLERGY